MEKRTGSTLAGSSGAPRSNLDFYQTPCHDVEKFLIASGLVPDSGIVLEPSAGDGNISTTVAKYRPHANVISGDIVEREFKLDYVADFLTQTFNKPVDGVITNPPFTHAEAFIRKGLEVCAGDVIMLLKLAFLETQGRAELFGMGHLREVYVSRSRINCYAPDAPVSSTGRRTNSSTMAMAWFVFNRNYKGDPVLKWV